VQAKDIWRHVDSQRADLADFLDTLTAEQWSTPSLCDRWTVRDVAVHITQSSSSWMRPSAEAARSGFRFNAMVCRYAREDTKTGEEITAAMRAMVGSRRRPPGTAEADPLVDALVHGQDIAIPLGVTRPMPTAAAVAAAERLWAMHFPLNPSRRFHNVAFTATDARFCAGDGHPVHGSIRDIVLVLAGRPAGLTGMSGQLEALAAG
jgi:uncharacterized protein (TIGR03083 family)